jgi:hypothetical protein
VLPPLLVRIDGKAAMRIPPALSDAFSRREQLVLRARKGIAGRWSVERRCGLAGVERLREDAFTAPAR